MEKLQKLHELFGMHNYVANKESKSSRFVTTAQYVRPCPCESFYRAVDFFISFIGFHYLYIITQKRFKKIFDVVVQSNDFPRNSGAWNELKPTVCTYRQKSTSTQVQNSDFTHFGLIDNPFKGYR